MSGVLFFRGKSIFSILIFAMAVSAALCFFVGTEAFASDRSREKQYKGEYSVALSKTGFGVTLLEWKNSDAALKVKGYGAGRKKAVEIYDTGSNSLLGRTESEENGTFALEIKPLPYPPCEIRILLFDGRTALSGYTRNMPENCGKPDQVVLENLVITGPAKINENSSAQYRADAFYSDGSSEDVTASAVWHETSDYANFSTAGMLNTIDVMKDEPILISASYSLNEMTSGSSLTVPIIDVPGPGEAELTRLTIDGPAIISETKSIQYIATAFYSDGSSKDVTASAVWHETSDYANFSTAGMLNTIDVMKDEPILISASYSLNGMTAESETFLTIQDASVPVTGSHAGRFNTFEGSKTCIGCHYSEALEVHGSVHYQWQGDASEAVGLNSKIAGKLGGINDFCIYPDINWIGKLTNTYGNQVDGGCAKCHVGLGEKPTKEVSEAQLENIDCLICHADGYKRTVQKEGDKLKFVPDTQNMSIGLLEAASNVTRPSKDSCLNCHTKAGGGNNLKRGDLEEAHRNPTRKFDVHMASAENGGAGLECLNCHTAAAHKIAGRGTDLRPRDSIEKMSCSKCHTETPHDKETLNRHTAKVNCTVCHIPVFAKAAATDMDRDWSQPGVFLPENGLYEPHHTKESNVIPEYRFFNGTSRFYQFGEPAVPEGNGRITMAAPMGSRSDSKAKLYAFKYHLGNQPIDPVTQLLLPLKIGKFFESGKIDQAVELGATEAGLGYNGHEFAQTERYLGLFHEVAPKEDALSCNDCHNSGTRIDFDSLGYRPNNTYNNRPLCSSCHGEKSNEWSGSGYFTKLHAKHVEDKKFDCSKCHGFSR